MSVVLHSPKEIASMGVEESIGKYVKYNSSELVYRVERVLSREEKLKEIENIFSSKGTIYALKHKLIQRSDSLCCLCVLV